MASIIQSNLEIQLQGRTDRQAVPISQGINNAYVDSVVDQSAQVQVGIFNSIIGGMEYSIASKCTQYELGKAQYELGKDLTIDEKKKLKKELTSEIGVLKKFTEGRVTVLKEEIGHLELQIKSFSILFRIFPSIFSKKSALSFLIPILYNQDQLNTIDALSSKHNEMNRLEVNRLLHVNIENRMNEMQGIWRPREITKESVVKRLQLLSREDLIPLLDGADFKNLDLNLNTNGSITLNDDLDLVITNKNNYYLVLKKDELGKGTFKTVYEGLDLSKNRPVAIGYLQNGKTKNKNFKEEVTYVTLKGIKGVAKTIDCLGSKNDCIFIFSLYQGNLNVDLSKEESIVRKNKNQFCKKLIDTLISISERGIILSDLKPGNIYLDGEGNPIVGDLDTEGVTPKYCAPEGLYSELRNEKSVVWSLATVFYTIYCNNYTFLCDYVKKHDLPKTLNEEIYVLSQLQDESIAELFKDKKDEVERYRPNDVPFLETIQEMLKVNPKDRPSLKEVAEAWELKIQKNQV